MEYILFDKNVVNILVSSWFFQSYEYPEGVRLIQHICGDLTSEIFQNIAIEYTNKGVIFTAKATESPTTPKFEIFCIDLTTCNILSDRNSPAELMTVLQKTFRNILKTWNGNPFSSSELVSGTKTVLFPFVRSDHRRIVIERKCSIERLVKRGIKSPLLAYKYNDESPPQCEETVNTSILKLAGEEYITLYYGLQAKLNSQSENANPNSSYTALGHVITKEAVERGDFIYRTYTDQLKSLTNAQKNVVEFDDITTPLRIDGPAGTGKTLSMLMRAYRLLQSNRENGMVFSCVFFTHSQSTAMRNLEVFKLYSDSEYYLSPKSMQKIEFTTLLEYCRKCTNIKPEMIVDIDAGDAKSYQLMLIQSVVDRYEQNNIIRTFIPLLSSELSDAFNESRTNRSALFSMLQHEFSIQIKGRTNCTIDEYYEIPSIENGLPCKNKKDKEFIFELFNVYQDELKNMGSFDLDDVIMESLSHLNAPLWRRQRSELGFDYIFADEMHMFNLNEQSVFHYLTKSWRHGDIAICFALDYSQAIGDRGDITRDYANTAFGNVTNTNYATVFRNSPAITELCTSIAVSGTLMFQDNFKNPYISTQSSFTSIEEAKSSMPVMIMYPNDEAMKGALGRHIESVMKALQCKPCEIAVISFIPGLCGKSGVAELENLSGKHFSPLLNNHISDSQKYVLASPYEINGLEFKAVILLGVDEGRVPQTAGTSDISKQYIHYTAYNLLYLTISRAKYKVVILGNSLNGVSSCLQHSLNKNYLLLENIYNA